METEKATRINYVTLILGIASAIIPLIEVSTLLDGTLLPRNIFLNVINVLLILPLLFQRGGINFQQIKWAIPLFLLAAIYGISIFQSLSQADTTLWFTKTFTYATFFFVLVKHQFEGNILWRKLTLFLFISFALSISLMFFDISTVQDISFLKKSPNLHQIRGPFNHKNLFSSFLLLLLATICFQTFNQRKYLIFTLLAIAIFLVSIVFLQSKAVILSIVIGFGVLFFPWIFGFSKKYKRKLLAIFGLITTLVIVLVLYKFENIKDIVFTGSLEERYYVWQNTFEMIKEHPVLGVGGGNFQIYFPKYGLEEFTYLNKEIALGYETFQRPHNDFLWIFSETGFIGIFVYLFFIGSILVYSIKKSSSKGLKNRNKYFVFVLFLIAYIVIAIFDFPWERSEHQMMFLLFLTQVLPTNSAKSKSTPKKNNKVIIVILLALVSISAFNIFFLSKRTENEKHSRKVIELHSMSKWNNLIREVTQIDTKFYAINNYSIPVVWYKGVAEYATQKHKKALLSFKNAYELNPYQVHVINNLAGSKLENGHFNEAISYYDEALTINPSHREILLNKSIAYFQNDSIEKSFQIFMEIDFDNKWSQLYNQAFSVVFNKYLKNKIENNPDKDVRSWENIIKSDSLKQSIIYEYHHNNQDWRDLLEIYNFLELE